MKNINDIPLILRREIEARMLKPFIEAFSKEIGEEKTLKITEEVIEDLAKEAGEASAERLGDDSPASLLEHLKPHISAGALEINEISKDENHNRFDVVRCAYVDMYEELGLRDKGHILSCNRDECFFQGINSNFKFTRTKTLMNGDDHCNFHVELDNSERVEQK